MSKVTLDNKYKADAVVGKEQIKDAEYLSFKHLEEDFLGTKSKPKTFKDKIEDIWDNICWPFYRIKHWLKDIYYEIRYGFERMFKGYDSVDCFEIFAKFTERYEKILKEYRKYHYGYPADMTVEEWEHVIDDMIYHLHYMDEENVNLELSKGMPEDWTPSSKTVYEIMERHKNDFFNLFSKHFYNLWD